MSNINSGRVYDRYNMFVKGSSVGINDADNAQTTKTLQSSFGGVKPTVYPNTPRNGYSLKYVGSDQWHLSWDKYFISIKELIAGLLIEECTIINGNIQDDLVWCSVNGNTSICRYEGKLYNKLKCRARLAKFRVIQEHELLPWHKYRGIDNDVMIYIGEFNSYRQISYWRNSNTYELRYIPTQHICITEELYNDYMYGRDLKMGITYYRGDREYIEQVSPIELISLQKAILNSNITTENKLWALTLHQTSNLLISHDLMSYASNNIKEYFTEQSDGWVPNLEK